MKLTTEDLSRLHRQQTARAVAGRAECLSEEAMLRIAEGNVDQAERQQTVEHLMNCSDCADEYRILLELRLELRPWAERAALAVKEPVPIAEPAGGRPERTTRAVSIHPSPSPGGRLRNLIDGFSPGIAAAAAVLLLIANLVLVIWITSLKRENTRISARLNEQLTAHDQASRTLADTRRQIDETDRRTRQQEEEMAELRRAAEAALQPQINVPIFDLELQGIRSGDEGRTMMVAVPANANLFTVIMHVTGARSFSDYALTVLDERGRSIRSLRGLRRSEADTFTITLPSRLLPAGRYRLRLQGLRAEISEPLGDYSIRLRYQ